MSVVDETTTAILDATRAAVLDFGVRRTTLSDVARRAGVSRMTVYRRYPDVDALLRELMTREFGQLLRELDDEAWGADARTRLIRALVGGVRALREHPLFRKVLAAEPEVMLPYVVERVGGTQAAALALIEHELERGRADGSIPDGGRRYLAGTLLLVVQSFALSGEILEGVASERLLDELARLLDRALRPRG